MSQRQIRPSIRESSKRATERMCLHSTCIPPSFYQDTKNVKGRKQAFLLPVTEMRRLSAEPFPA